MKPYNKIILLFIIVLLVGSGILIFVALKIKNKNLSTYDTATISFKYPSTVEPSTVQGFQGGFDHTGRLAEIKRLNGGDFANARDVDYVPEIQFIDNSDTHIKSIGKIIQQDLIKIGKYSVTKIERNLSQNDTGYWADWGNYPICTIQYHLFDGKYIFCQDYWNDVTDGALEIMIKTFKVKR